MDLCSPSPSRRHNPVDSICRKLQTIQWRGDREPNSPFQIPKLSSSSYDSPQCNLRHNLEAILKKGSVHEERGKVKGTEMPQRNAMGPSTPECSTPTPANITYTITSTLGERRGADGSDFRHYKPWQKYNSPPMTQTKDSPYFTVTQGTQSVDSQSERHNRSNTPLSRTFTPGQSTVSYNLNFCSADAINSPESELPYPALVVKRLTMEDGGSSLPSEHRKGNMTEISLICEENLLDTIFHACDTQRRGKVYVSHIVDYLRHTTSRSSEDSGLEELCNMLDPDQKDISIDLDTYHAVMREWIDDCRNNREISTEDPVQDSIKHQDSLAAKRSMLLNMTSGSLEAFGGEASRADFETSELMYCVSDLQMNNQKLQEEVRKLKLIVEGLEESNQKLAEEKEDLRNQARVHQQLAQKEKILKEEVEEMKVTLSCTEEGRARASAHSRNVEKENQSLITKIASLQEENFKVTMETDDLQRRITELCDINADLQVQIHSFDAVITEKEAVILEKGRQIDELKAAVEEYSSITELLRVHKSKLENQIQMILPDLAGASFPLSGAYRLNQSSLGSLQTELALAQSPLESPLGLDQLSTSMSIVSSLDETLDKEVLLMLQGPSPEHMSLEFKSLLNQLQGDFREDASSVISAVRSLLDNHTQPADSPDSSLQTVRAELDARRADWVVSLDQLAQYTDSLEKELIKMASNMRRSRTEILHLSVRVQEQENQKRQLCDELEQLKTPQDSREASSQTPAPEDEPGDDLDWDEEFALQDFLKNELAERNCQARDGCREEKTPHKPVDRGEEEDGDERWTVVDPDVRDASTPLSTVSAEGRSMQDSTVGAEVPYHHQQDKVPSDAHSQAASIRHPEAADAPSHPSHSENNGVCESAESQSCGQTTSKEDQTITPENNQLPTDKMVSPNSSSPALDASIEHSESTKGINEERGVEELKDGEASGDMRSSKNLSQDILADRSGAEDSLLPVVPEEEESVQESVTEAPALAANVPGTDRLASSGPNSGSETSSPPSGSSLTHANQPGSAMTSDPGHSEELARNMETTEPNKLQEDQSDTSMATEKESETSVLSDSGEMKDDKSSLSATDKEIEAEFQRLALGFKCDMFTLEKRLRLEERSRDLAEENVRREVSSCQGLLQALTPLCEDDNQSMEIILRLQKNLDILIQSMTRVSSRSEMLGAIHQESRIGRAVEIMIQHVENLRRLYTKEHAELLELREALMQNERSFGSQTERDDFRGKKQSSSQYYKSSARRVSIAAIPRSAAGNMHFDMSKTQDCSEAEAERLTRRSPWNMAGRGASRPPLKRFVSSAAWVETEEPSLMMKGTACTDSQSEDEQKEEKVAKRRRSSLSELGSKLTSLILPLKTPSPSSSPISSDPGMAHSLSHSLTSSRAAAAAVARGSRGIWLWLAILVVLAGLLALLASLVMQPAVDAAPIGTGDSWMTIQQLLWPYTGLRHNAQPPV